jgi:hypothetical protein
LDCSDVFVYVILLMTTWSPLDQLRPVNRCVIVVVCIDIVLNYACKAPDINFLQTLAVKLYAKAEWLPATRQETQVDHNQPKAKKKNTALVGLSDDVKRALEVSQEL